jgi:hypothetical protein
MAAVDVRDLPPAGTDDDPGALCHRRASPSPPPPQQQQQPVTPVRRSPRDKHRLSSGKGEPPPSAPPPHRDESHRDPPSPPNLDLNVECADDQSNAPVHQPPFVQRPKRLGLSCPLSVHARMKQLSIREMLGRSTVRAPVVGLPAALQQQVCLRADSETNDAPCPAPHTALLEELPPGDQFQSADAIVQAASSVPHVPAPDELSCAFSQSLSLVVDRPRKGILKPCNAELLVDLDKLDEPLTPAALLALDRHPRPSASRRALRGVRRREQLNAWKRRVAEEERCERHQMRHQCAANTSGSSSNDEDTSADSVRKANVSSNNSRARSYSRSLRTTRRGRQSIKSVPDSPENSDSDCGGGGGKRLRAVTWDEPVVTSVVVVSVPPEHTACQTSPSTQVIEEDFQPWPSASSLADGKAAWSDSYERLKSVDACEWTPTIDSDFIE